MFGARADGKYFRTLVSFPNSNILGQQGYSAKAPSCLCYYLSLNSAVAYGYALDSCDKIPCGILER